MSLHPPARFSGLYSAAVLHSNWPEGADELCRAVVELSPDGHVIAVDVTPVIGVHVGPKGIGIAAVSAEQSVAKDAGV